MNDVLFIVLYGISSLFLAYVINKYYRIFYSYCRYNRWIEGTVFIVVHIILSLLYWAGCPPELLLISNVVGYFLLCFLYSNHLRKNLLNCSIIIITYIVIEIAVVYTMLLSDPIGVETTIEYDSLESITVDTLIKIIMYLVVVIIRRLQDAKEEYQIPTKYWISILIIPIGAVALGITIFSTTKMNPLLFFVLGCVVFSMTFASYILYDCISNLLVEQMNHRLLLEKEKYYENQLVLMKSTLHDVRTLRHDLKNKVTPLYVLAEQDNKALLLERITEIMESCGEDKIYAKTNCIDVDSILNFKLAYAQKFTNQITTQIEIPSDLTLPDFDMAVILGNLLDNAIEGIQTITTERWIDVKMIYSKTRIIITISNSFDGNIQANENGMISRKEDGQNHGIGLQSVESILNKYNGVIKVSNRDNIFVAKVLLYT